ncbi:MAG TPA: PKD domain-containing protein [Candidatus Thermoplasmatota archaeon]
MKSVLAVVAVLVIAATSGCLADPEAKDVDGAATTASVDSTSNETASNETMNSAPVANLTADPDNGSAPLAVNFTINATDADGDNLTWSLDADGDGTSDGNGTDADLPGNVSFAYAAAGLYNATLTVDDGTANTTATIAINVTAGGATMEPVAFSEDVQLPCPQCTAAGANTGVGYRAGESGVDSAFFDLLPEFVGQPFTATSSGGSLGMVFRDSCDAGAAIGSVASGAGSHTGTVPEGALCVLMWDDESADSTIAITIGGPAPA